MDDIVIPMKILKDFDLSINEYLVLYNIVNKYTIDHLLDVNVDDLMSLESKGFIKLSPDKIFLRERTEKIFTVNTDLFVQWLDTYPVRVKKTRSHGSRAVSPKDPDTMLGKALRKKWDRIFKKNIQKQELAIRVLELHIKEMEKSGDLEFMVEASRWLNEGYHEKYSYLLEESLPENQYENEDYL